MTNVGRGVVVVTVIGAAVSAVLAFWGDLPAVGRALTHFPLLYVLPVIGLTVWNYGIRWLKWQWYLRILGVRGVNRIDSALIFISGFAMGMTPGKAGELTKSYWLRELAEPGTAPFARTSSIVFAERLTDGIAMLLLATVGLAAVQFGGTALAVVGVLAVVGIGLLQARPLVHAVLHFLERIPRISGLAKALESVYDSARELLTLPRLVLSIGMGVLSWGGECVALYVIVLGLGAPPSLELLNQSTFALAAASLLGSALLLPGGLGAVEFTVAKVLEDAGLSPDISAAATILIRICTLWFGVALGAIALPILTRRILAFRAPTH